MKAQSGSSENIDMDAEKAANLGVFLNMKDYRCG